MIFHGILSTMPENGRRLGVRVVAVCVAASSLRNEKIEAATNGSMRHSLAVEDAGVQRTQPSIQLRFRVSRQLAAGQNCAIMQHNRKRSANTSGNHPNRWWLWSSSWPRQRYFD